MSEKIPDLFHNLSLSHWYKYLLYVAGVLLVVGVVFGSKIPNIQIISFSLWTIVLMIFLWIIDDILYAVVNDKNFNTALGIRITLHFVFFLFWIIIAVVNL